MWAAILCCSWYALEADVNTRTPSSYYIAGQRTWELGTTIDIVVDRWDNDLGPFRLTPQDLLSIVARAEALWHPGTARFAVRIGVRIGDPQASIRDCATLDAVAEKVQIGILVVFDNSKEGTLFTCHEKGEPPFPGGTTREEPLRTEMSFPLPPCLSWPCGQLIRRKIVVMNTFRVRERPTFETILAHELGHSLGLEHSLVDPSLDPRVKPLMSPAPFGFVRQPDDEASISDLYRNLPLFNESYGWIEGRVIDQQRRPLKNVAVIAMEAGAGRVEDLTRRYSTITRQQLRENDIMVAGTFRIPALAGRYILRVEPIDPSVHLQADFGPSPERPRFEAVPSIGPFDVVVGKPTLLPNDIQIPINRIF
jgi:hypothetical protein